MRSVVESVHCRSDGGIVKRRSILAVTVVAAVIAVVIVRASRQSIDAADAEQLAAVADQWWAERSGPDPSVIPESAWPPEVRRLRPESVRISADGVLIRRGSLFTAECGWFVLPSESRFRPGQGTDPSFRHLSGRVYWYEIKG
jgi:hypothetical protein